MMVYNQHANMFLEAPVLSRQLQFYIVLHLYFIWLTFDLWRLSCLFTVICCLIFHTAGMLCEYIHINRRCSVDLDTYASGYKYYMSSLVSRYLYSQGMTWSTEGQHCSVPPRLSCDHTPSAHLFSAISYKLCKKKKSPLSTKISITAKVASLQCLTGSPVYKQRATVHIHPSSALSPKGWHNPGCWWQIGICVVNIVPFDKASLLLYSNHNTGYSPYKGARRWEIMSA